MSVNKIFSVCMPFLGDYESLFLSIENCLGMEIVGEVIVFEKIINTNFEVEIHKRFNGNPKIIDPIKFTFCFLISFKFL